MISSIDTIPRTNVSYLGWEETIKNKEKLDEFNSQFDLKIDESSLKNSFQQSEDTKQTQIVEKKEESQRIDINGKKEVYVDEIETKPATDIEKTTQLAHVMQHNVLQNIPTQDIMRLRGDNA
jgi:hypothetical protein